MEKAGTSPDLAIEFAVEPEVAGIAGALGREWVAPFEATIRALWRVEGRGRGGQIGIVLVNADRMHGMNREYRGTDRPTDVLTFDLADSPDEIEGEIYIGADIAEHQARAGEWTFAEEIARVVVHGCLHLAGYDHHSPADGRKMAAATRRWLALWRERSVAV